MKAALMTQFWEPVEIQETADPRQAPMMLSSKLRAVVFAEATGMPGWRTGVGSALK